MPQYQKKKIKSLLREEVAKRSTSSSVAYAIISMVVFFYHFKLERFEVPVKFAAIVVFAAGILRLLAARSFIRHQEDSAWRGIQVGVWINSLAWSVIYGLSAYELKNQSIHFVILVTVMTGALSGSLVTLSNCRTLYFPFMAGSLIPLVTVAFIQLLSWQTEGAGYLLLCYSVFAVYTGMQFHYIHAIQVDRVKKQVDLEASLEELKQSQDAFVRQTAKLFHASKLSALGEMAGGLSHEVNNSLMTIMGSVQQLDRYFQRDKIDNPEYAKKIQVSHQAISQIKTVIDGLRFFSQQADEGEKNDRPLEEIIQRTLNFCNEMVKANEITMIVAPVPPVMVHCNPMQITQILFYLTKNAFDALEGVNDPMKRWIRISFIEREQDVEIRVMNGGPQITPDVKNRLFQPFFTTKEVGKGTGLSLSISKGIALAHRGDIYLDDNTDCTTFALKIPAAPLAGVAHA